MFPSGKIIGSDTDSGLYVVKTNFTMTGTGGYVNNIIPGKFTLDQNYPNPFNPITNIRIDIPFTQKIELSVYDVLGRKVKDLYDDILNAGQYNFKLDGSDLASGVYFYRIKTDSFTAAKKLLLIK